MQRPFRPSGSPIWPWAPPKPQVLKDYQEGTAIEWEKLPLDEQEKFKRFQFLEVKRTFQAELTAEEAQEKTEIERHYSFGKKRRSANADFLRKFDNMLLRGTGEGRSRFVPKKRLGPLSEGQRRYVTDIELPDGSHVRRSCIAAESGDPELELPRLVVAGQVCNPTLHVAMDQGATGWPAMQWCLLKKGLRMTVVPDILHRIHNDWLQAITNSGLCLVRLEYLQVLKMRRGPFAGHANSAILKGAAQEFRRCCDTSSVLFQAFYDLVLLHSEQLSSEPDIGSTRHMEATFQWACDLLESVGAGMPLGATGNQPRGRGPSQDISSPPLYRPCSLKPTTEGAGSEPGLVSQQARDMSEAYLACLAAHVFPCRMYCLVAVCICPGTCLPEAALALKVQRRKQHDGGASSRGPGQAWTVCGSM